MAQRAREIRVEPTGFHEIRKRAPRIRRRHHERGRQLLATVEHHAAHLAAAYADARGLCVAHGDSCAQQLCEIGRGRAKDAARAAGVVMEQPEGGAGGPRALLEMPHGKGAKRTLQHIALEPVVEQLGGGHGQQAHQIFHALTPEPPHLESEAQIDEARRRSDVQSL